MEIYLVIRHLFIRYEYEEKIPVMVFTNEDWAKEHAVLANEWNRANLEKDSMQNPFDQLTYASANIAYYVQPTQLVDTKPMYFGDYYQYAK